MEPIVIPDPPREKTSEYKPRGVYSPRNRKVSSSSTTVRNSASLSSPSSERSVYKFNRKLKITTTASPNIEGLKEKRVETNNLLKKSQVRSSYYSRRNNTRNITSSSESIVNADEKSHQNLTARKNTLPKTSYYSRLRNKNKNQVSSTTEVVTEVVTFVEHSPAQNKMENSADMPLIFSLLKSPNENESKETPPENTKGGQEKKMFIIAVSSKESIENSTENEIMNKEDNNESKPILNIVPSSKFHANYKDHTVEVPENKEHVTPVSTPSIRNIQTRKYGRRRTKPKEVNEDIAEVTPKPRDRNLRKYSDSFSKTTEPSTNGVSNFFVII